MWRTILFLTTMVQTSPGKLTGDHICQEEQRYIVNATEYYIRNTTVRNYQWCLNVPPRCSYYTSRQVNDSRIVEKEVKKTVEKCCSGYEKNEDENICVPICPSCIHGSCKGGECICHPGFQGDNCDTECEPMKWGTNCKFNCRCERGTCLPVTGNCICPSGWNGSECQTPCILGFYGMDCKETCHCEIDEKCHHITGECERISITSAFTTVTDFSSTTFSSSQSTFPLETPTNTVHLKNNGKFKSKIQFNTTTTMAPESSKSPFLVIDKEEKSIVEFPIIKTDHKVISTDQQLVNYARMKEKEVSATSTLNSSDRENLLSDEAQEGNINQTPQETANSANVATAISVALIVIILAIIAAKNFRRKKEKRKAEAKRTSGVPTVSVYTHSIFHTPLPEPPTFENPVFAAPSENGDAKRFETRVVCSMNFPSQQEKDPREYLYDHPPSTGSYRAASIPEPSDIDNTNSIQTMAHSEPVYDEIPIGMMPTPISEPPPSYKSSSLYMNTCGKTRL